jgi:aquaporin Z
MSEAADPGLGGVEPTLVQKLAAEVLGTFVLVFFGVGSVFASGFAGGGGNGGAYAAVGLSFGFAVLVMAYAVGRISGGHFNPAVSVGAAMSGRISWVQAGMYSAAQVVGAVVASIVLFLVVVSTDTGYEFGDGLGANGFGDHGGVAWWGAIIVEMVCTAVFLYVILAVTDTRNQNQALAPLAIGISLAMIHFAAMGFTGTSVNPARSIGPALFSGGDAIIQLWLFILAPLAGASIAGLTYPLVFGRDVEPVPGSGLNLSRPAPAPAAWQGQQQSGQQWGQQQWGQQEGWGGEQQPGQQADPSQQWGQQEGWGGEQQGAQQGEQQWAGQQYAQTENAQTEYAQTEYPGWKWDAQAQQWVPDPATQQQQWPTQGTEGEENPRTQIRDPEGPA